MLTDVDYPVLTLRVGRGRLPIALRGSERETRRIATDYKVYYEKILPPGSDSYLIDHTAFIFLLDRRGRYVAYFPPGSTVERMAGALREALAQPG